MTRARPTRPLAAPPEPEHARMSDTPDPSAAPPGIDPRLLEVLVCPVTRGPLRWDRAQQELVSLQAGLAYPVRDGIPIMLPEEARVLDD